MQDPTQRNADDYTDTDPAYELDPMHTEDDRFKLVASSMTWAWSDPALPNLFERLARAQGELANPPKDKTAVVVSAKGKYAYDYSDLATVLDVVRPVFSKHGLALLQWPTTELKPSHDLVGPGRGPGTVWAYMTTVVAWGDGGVKSEWISGTCGLPLPDDKPQTLGAVQTYLRRYSINAVAAIMGETDDDANVAQGHAAQTMPREARPTGTPTRPTTGKPITEAQAKFLKVELDKHHVKAKDTVAWYNTRFGTKVKTPLEFLMSNFDAVLAWVRNSDEALDGVDERADYDDDAQEGMGEDDE